MFKFLFIKGLLPEGECTEKTECTTSQESDPVGNNCYKNDGYLRTMLYRAWLPSCSILPMYSTSGKWYVLDHHGTWRYGSEATLRCWPGYQLRSPPVHTTTTQAPSGGGGGIAIPGGGGGGGIAMPGRRKRSHDWVSTIEFLNSD